MIPHADDVLSVGDYTRQIKQLLEGEIAPAWVRGEVSNLRRQQSGHVYFTLKDRESQLPCVLFRGDAMRQRVELDEGQQCIVMGALSVYEPHGRYQMICRELVEDGVGRLQQAFEKLKKRLADEGLFDAGRKQALPMLPRTVGIVTSPTGAALKDFLSILKRRGWCGRVIIYPAKVQGAGAAREIVRQIEAAQASGEVDLLVVGRGGGSLEDLWCFNEEAVARAVAACELPVISAVGHEIDFTLSDFAADKRAETPSAAAELISSAYLECREQVRLAREGLMGSAEFYLERRANGLELIVGRMRAVSPERRIERCTLQLDDLAMRMGMASRELLHAGNTLLNRLQQRLVAMSPERRLELQQAKMAELSRRMKRIASSALKPRTERLIALRQRLENSSLQKTLARGFVTVRNEKGDLITRKQGLQSGDRLAIDFSDGEVHTEIKELSG